MTPIFKKCRKDNPVKHRLVSLIFVPGKVIEQLILETFPGTRQEGDQEYSAWLHKEEIMLD